MCALYGLRFSGVSVNRGFSLQALVVELEQMMKAAHEKGLEEMERVVVGEEEEGEGERREEGNRQGEGEGGGGEGERREEGNRQGEGEGEWEGGGGEREKENKNEENEGSPFQVQKREP